jgi:stearoyl-CoA desaturase (Delta-9 desaturase)
MLLPAGFDLPWWAYPLIAFGLTHLTIAAITTYLHRQQTHRALELHPVASRVFRFWLWLTTGMVTKQWVAVHRKHHAKVETPEDPHSPQIYGIARVLWAGVFLYAREARDRDVLERYGSGTPDDWVERHLYARCSYCGLIVMGFADSLTFGLGWGMLILAIQLIWIPFWAAGVINGMGHYWGYRNYAVEDAGRHPDRRRGVSQQPLRASDLRETVEHLVRVRHRLDVHTASRDAGLGPRREDRAGAAVPA